MAQIQGEIKKYTRADMDIELASTIASLAFFDPDDTAETRRENLLIAAQFLIDEFYPELTHQRIHIDADREWLRDATPEGVA